MADIVQRSLRQVEQNPTSIAAWNDLGRALYANGFPAEADIALSRSLEWNASQPKVWYLRGMVRREQYDLVGAIDDFAAAMKLDVTSPHLRWRAAWVAMENSDLPQAVELADEAMRLAPNDRNARRVRARLYLESDTPEKGVAMLGPLRQQNPADRDVLWLFARLMRASGQGAEAKQWADAAGTKEAPLQRSVGAVGDGIQGEPAAAVSPGVDDAWAGGSRRSRQGPQAFPEFLPGRSQWATARGTHACEEGPAGSGRRAL